MAMYLNQYQCPCGEAWGDQWDCPCNDKCPACNKEIEPHDSEILDLADRYADTIIGNQIDTYVCLEIRGVRMKRSVDVPGDRFCEVDDETPQFYSVFAGNSEGDMDCIGDFSSADKAREYASGIGARHNWPIRDTIADLCCVEAASTYTSVNVEGR